MEKLKCPICGWEIMYSHSDVLHVFECSKQTCPFQALTTHSKNTAEAIAAFEKATRQSGNVQYYCGAKRAGKIFQQMTELAKINPDKIEIIESCKGIQWISVKDRLPEEGTGIFLCFNEHCKEVWVFKRSRAISLFDTEATHWAEINLPKVKE
jgi:hypothetical protein